MPWVRGWQREEFQDKKARVKSEAAQQHSLLVKNQYKVVRMLQASINKGKSKMNKLKTRTPHTMTLSTLTCLLRDRNKTKLIKLAKQPDILEIGRAALLQLMQNKSHRPRPLKNQAFRKGTLPRLRPQLQDH